MSKENKNNVPQIAITTYMSNEDVEITNLFNNTDADNIIKIQEPILASFKPIKTNQKSKIILKSPIKKNVQKSLSPGLSDLNTVTDIEDISDSDNEQFEILTSHLSPGPIDYMILTDVEDLSEDEGNEKNKIIEEYTDTEHFTDDKEIFNEIEQNEHSIEPLLSYFPQPHKEILFHSKNGTISTLSPAEEINPIWLKAPNDEVKGFESEEEIITVKEFEETELYLKNNNMYYHDIDVGVIESVDSVKNERCKPKYKNHVVSSKKNVTSETDHIKKRFRNKNRCNTQIENIIEKHSEENKKNILSKYLSEPTLNKLTILPHSHNKETGNFKNKKNNNTFVINDNLNGFSISIDFESNNSVLLNIGRDYGHLSMKWYNNGTATGRDKTDHKNINILEPLEPIYFIKSSLYYPKQHFEVELFTYGTIKTFHNKYFTYIAVYTVTQSVNIVQLYINKPLQTQIFMIKKPLIKLYSLKDKFLNTKRINPSPVSQLSAFQIFNKKETKKQEEHKKIAVEYKKSVSDMINIFENMNSHSILKRKLIFNKLSNSNTSSQNNNLYQKSYCKCTQKLGDEVNHNKENAKSINNSDNISYKIFGNNRSDDFIYDNILLNRAISHSREELAKLVKAVEILENKVEMQEHFSPILENNKEKSENSFSVNNLDHQKKFYQLLINNVQNQESQIRNSLNNIKQTLDYFEFSKTQNKKEIHKNAGPSLRNNFNTASLPHRWWNRSMPCLPLLERQIYLSGSHDSLTESFQVCYFTPKKKKSISRISNNQNSGYCIWLPNNKSENDRTQIRPLMVRTPSENTVTDNYEHLDEWKLINYSKISPDTVQEKLKTMLSDPSNHDETLTNFLIDMLIEQETAKLAASGELSSGSSDSDPHETPNIDELSNCPSPIPIVSSPQFRRNGDISSQRLLKNQRPTPKEIHKHDSESDNEIKYIVTEPLEKSPSRKVTFRLESEDDEIIYPGQSENENDLKDCNVSTSANNHITNIENMTFEIDKDVGEKTLKRVERRFERMASETLEDSPIAKQAVEGEYHRIISQLSNEEVDVANQIWDGAERSPELTSNANNLALQNIVDKIPPKPIPRHSIDNSITSSINEDDINYSTKKQFWEEITKTNQPPLPKPRYSISLPIKNSEKSLIKNASLELTKSSFDTSDYAEVPEMINKSMSSNQTTENIVVSEFTCQKSKLLDEQPLYNENTNVIKEIKRLDSETEYVNKYGEDSLAFENKGFQEDVFDNKDLIEKDYPQYSDNINSNTKSRSMSLPSSQIEHIPSKKYFQQIKPQMEGIQMEQESSPEHKSLKNTVYQQSLSQEVLINRQIHKHIFSNELDEQIDSLIPEDKYLNLKCEKNISINSLQDMSSEKMSCNTSEKSITKTESAESSILDDLPEEKINKIISKQSKDKNSSSLTHDHIDEIPSDTYSFIEGKEKTSILTESIESSMIDDEVLHENYSVSSHEKEKRICSQIVQDHIIYTPEEHIPDTIWEVTQLRTEDQELENIEFKDQHLFHQNFVKHVDSSEPLENIKSEMTEELARNIAEQLINEIEIELTKRHDILANLHHSMMSPDQLIQLENSGYLDMEGDDLKLKIMESVLAKKSRDQLKSISKNDTLTSSIEITDEDLKSSGFEIEFYGLTIKPRVTDNTIPEHNDDKSEKKYPYSNSNEIEQSSREEKEEYCIISNDNLVIETFIKEQQNETNKQIESQHKDILKGGQIEHESISNKHYQDNKTDVFEKVAINENGQQIEIKELGSHYSSKNNSDTHDIIHFSEVSEIEKEIEFNENVTGIDSYESHSKEYFEVETKQNKYENNIDSVINEKHIDTLTKDFDDELIKEQQHFEHITDNGSNIYNIDKEEYRTTSYILKETIDSYKNEVTIKKESESFSSKTLTKQLSAESLSKDNSMHSPTSPSSSSIDIREEKHVNFDAVVLRKIDSTNTNKLSAKRPADSSSSDSHYHSFDLTSSSRPCSSDVDGLLAGSSEYESAMSVPSNEFNEYHTAISSLSSKESMKSLDSESSGNLASVENSEASETLIASTGDLDFDQEGTNSMLDDEDKIESYEQEIPMHIIRGESLPIIAESTEMKYSSMYKTQPFSQPAINSEKNMQKMKRSHEMTFHPIPKHITSDSLSDSSSHDEKLFSSEDASMSISSTEGQAIHTVVEAVNGFPESETYNFNQCDENMKSVETSTSTTQDENENNKDQYQHVTIISSSVTNGTHQNVCTQMTTKFEETQKKGHRRNGSSVNKIIIADLETINNKDKLTTDIPKECTVTDESLEHTQDTLKNVSLKEKNIFDSETEIFKLNNKHNYEIHASIIPDKHSFEHIDDIAEADAAFQMVPHLSPAIPASLPPTILEDPFSEDEDDLKNESNEAVPNIMITEHMAPLVDRGFHYPDLDLEAKELEIKTSTPQTPASISSKESSETDQGKEYIINEDYDPHEESSWTGEEHTILEKVEGTEEKEFISLSESFELGENIEEKLDDSENEFVVIEEIGKEAKEEDSEGKAIQIEGKSNKTHTNFNNDCQTLYDSKNQFELEYANQKWVELQFEDENLRTEVFELHLQYPCSPLEDIKEEDTDELQSSKIGSIDSQVSHSIDSLGSMKESFSSTPESKKYLGKSLETDNISVSSLQEFERLEQLIRIESMKAKSSGSLASTTSSSNSRKDDLSLASLKEFETIEAACFKTELIENEALAIEKSLTEEESIFKINEINEETEINFEQNEDNSERHISEDDNLTSTESLDLKTIVTDMKASVSLEHISSAGFVEEKHNDYDECMNSSVSSRGFSSPTMDDQSKESSYRNSLILGSNDSLGPISSTSTNATYHCETGSNMSSSFTSGGSNTMVSSMEGLDKTGGKHDWFDEHEIHKKDIDGTEFTHKIIRLPSEMHKVTARGPDKEQLLEHFVDNFAPGEYQEDIERIDEHGNVFVTRIVQKRMVFDSEELEKKSVSKNELNECLKKLSKDASDEFETSKKTSIQIAGSSEEPQELSTSNLKQELQVAATKPELKYEISMDDDTEIDLREHDWRFQHQINTEIDDITKPSTSGCTGKSQPKENVSEL